MTKKSTSNGFNQAFWFSAIRLLLANILILVLALYLRWDLLEIILLYTIQSVIIGITQRLKIRDIIKHISQFKKIKQSVARPLLHKDAHSMFVVLYTLAMLPVICVVIYKFIIQVDGKIPYLPVLIGSVLFFCIHWWSYKSNKETDRLREAELTNLFLIPLVRLTPLYVFAFNINSEFVRDYSTLVIWMILKTIVDVGIHVNEHKPK